MITDADLDALLMEAECLGQARGHLATAQRSLREASDAVRDAWAAEVATCAEWVADSEHRVAALRARIIEASA